MAVKKPKLVGQEAFVLAEEIPPFVASDYASHHRDIVKQRRSRLNSEALVAFKGYKQVTNLEFLPETITELRVVTEGLTLRINKARRRVIDDPNPEITPRQRRRRIEWARMTAGQIAVKFHDQAVSHRRQLFYAVDPDSGRYDLEGTKTELATSGLERYQRKIEFFNDQNYPHPHWRKKLQPYRQSAAAFVAGLTDRQRLDFFYEALWDVDRRQLHWAEQDPRPKNMPAEPSWDTDYFGDYEEWLQPEPQF